MATLSQSAHVPRSAVGAKKSGSKDGGAVQHYFREYKLSYLLVDSLPRPTAVAARQELIKSLQASKAVQKRLQAKGANGSTPGTRSGRSLPYTLTVQPLSEATVCQLEQLAQVDIPEPVHTGIPTASRQASDKTASHTAHGSNDSVHVPTGAHGSSTLSSQPCLSQTAAGQASHAHNAALDALLSFDHAVVHEHNKQQSVQVAQTTKPERRTQRPLTLTIQYQQPASLSGKVNQSSVKRQLQKRVAHAAPAPQARAADMLPAQARDAARMSKQAQAQATRMHGPKAPAAAAPQRGPHQQAQPEQRQVQEGAVNTAPSRTDADWSRLTTANIRSADGWDKIAFNLQRWPTAVGIAAAYARLSVLYPALSCGLNAQPGISEWHQRLQRQRMGPADLLPASRLQAHQQAAAGTHQLPRPGHQLPAGGSAAGTSSRASSAQSTAAPAAVRAPAAPANAAGASKGAGMGMLSVPAADTTTNVPLQDPLDIVPGLRDFVQGPLQQLTSQHIASMQPRELATVLCGAGRIGIAMQPEVLRGLLLRLGELWQSCNAQDVSLVLWGLEKQQVMDVEGSRLPEHVLGQVWKSIQPMLHACSPQPLTMSLHSLAKLGWRPRDAYQLEVIEKLMCKAAPSMGAKDVVAALGCLSCCFGSGGTLNGADAGMDEVCDTSSSPISFTGLEELMKPHPITLQTLLVRASQLMHTMNGLEVSLLLYCMARLQMRVSPAALRWLQKHAMGHMLQLPLGHLALHTWSVARLKALLLPEQPMQMGHVPQHPSHANRQTPAPALLDARQPPQPSQQQPPARRAAPSHTSMQSARVLVQPRAMHNQGNLAKEQAQLQLQRPMLPPRASKTTARPASANASSKVMTSQSSSSRAAQPVAGGPPITSRPVGEDGRAWIRRLLYSVRMRAQDLSPLSLPLLMHSMTRFPLTPRMRAAITPVLLKRSLQHFEASMAADYARINGSMPCTCSAGLRASGGRNGSSTQQHVEGYGPRQLAALASAMPYLLRPSSQRNVVLWWELLKRRCEQVNLTNFHPHSLAVLLWALGRASKQLTPTLRVQAQAAVAALLPPSQAAGPGPRMHAWQRAFNPRELGLVVWAFAELRMQPSIKLQKALLARIEEVLPQLSLRGLVAVLHAMVRTSNTPCLSAAWLSAAEDAISMHLATLTLPWYRRLYRRLHRKIYILKKRRAGASRGAARPWNKLRGKAPGSSGKSFPQQHKQNMRSPVKQGAKRSVPAGSGKMFVGGKQGSQAMTKKLPTASL